MYQKGIAKVSPQVSLSDWPEFGKREHFQALHANMNEPIVFQDISRYCKVSRLVVHHIAFHGLEPLSRKKSA